MRNVMSVDCRASPEWSTHTEDALNSLVITLRTPTATHRHAG